MGFQRVLQWVVCRFACVSVFQHMASSSGLQEQKNIMLQEQHGYENSPAAGLLLLTDTQFRTPLQFLSI